MMADRHRLALSHLHAAMAALSDSGDTLSLATIAQAVSVVERDLGGMPGGAVSMLKAANRRPC